MKLEEYLGISILVGVSILVCGGSVKYGLRDNAILHPKASIVQQAGENMYHFVCLKEDRKNCDKKEEYLYAVYEGATFQHRQHAPISWISDMKYTQDCSRDSYTLDQCYDLAPKRAEFYKRYLEERVIGKQHE